jgi:predicted permease
LIVAEIALSVLLLAGAGLLVRSFANMRGVAPGFDPHNVLTMRVTLPMDRYRGPAVPETFQQIIDRVAETPGVRSVAMASQFPPTSPFSTPFRLDGAEPATTLPTALITVASDRYFDTLGVPIVRGRAFTDRDRAGAPAVVMVNQAFAARYAPGRDIVGMRVSTGPADRPSPPMEIVGVAADTRNRGVRTPPAPELFVPMQQEGMNNQLFLLIRTSTDALAMLPAVRERIAMVDRDQPVYAIQTMDDAFAADSFQQRLSLIFVGLFAGVGLVLAGIGIYGVMSYAVSARTREIGVRMAVGAARADVVWLVLRQVLTLTGAGVAIGFTLLAAVSGGLRAMLFEVRPLDPLTLSIVVIVLSMVAVIAAWVPAWRASRVDPMTTLRYE